MDQQQQAAADAVGVDHDADNDDTDEDDNDNDDDDDDDDTDEDNDEDDDEDDTDEDDEEEYPPIVSREQRFNEKLESIRQQNTTTATATAYRVARNVRRNKSIKIFQRRNEFPLRQRQKIDFSLFEIFDDLEGDSSNAVAVAAAAAVDAAVDIAAYYDNDNNNDSEDERRLKLIWDNTRRLKLLLLLQRLNKVPDSQRNTIDVLVDMFLDDLGDDIHEMICDQNADNYRGLDSDRDTIKEVETIVRFFPNLLSKKKDVVWDYIEEGEFFGWVAIDVGEGNLPIQCILDVYGPEGVRCNLKALPFLSDLARLGKELNQFEDHERGGLFVEDEQGYSPFFRLIHSDMCRYGEEHNQLVDDVYLTQMIQLRRMGLVKKEDIRGHHLVHALLWLGKEIYFAENRFQFLVQWDPTALVQKRVHRHDMLPLHCIAKDSTIEAFRTVFIYCIRYYPNKKGIRLLFQKDNNGDTPFQDACQRHGRDVVMTVIEEILSRFQIEGTPITIVEAVVMAAIDGNVHLDCVYFLLRREPHVLVRLLSGPHINNNDDDDDDGGRGGGGGNHNDGNDVDDDEDDADDDNDEDNEDDDEDDNSDEDGDINGDSDGGIVDSNNNGADTRKRKRSVWSINLR